MADPDVDRVAAPDGLAKNIPYAIYVKLCGELSKILAKHFDVVRRPIENTDTKERNDIIFFVAGTRRSLVKAFGNQNESVKILEVQNTKASSDGPSIKEIHWPWPKHIEGAPPNSDLPGEDWVDSNKPVKVMLHIWESKDKLANFLTDKDHKELAKLLGWIISPYGLKYRKDALYLRVPGVDSEDKTTPYVKMIDGTHEIMDYLGLSLDIVQIPVVSWQPLMEYAVACRFYDAKRVTKLSSQLPETSKDADHMGIFDYFAREWIPAQDQTLKGEDAAMTREEVITEAKARCPTSFAAEFDAASENFKDQLPKKALRQHLPRFVKKAELTHVVKGLLNAIRMKDWSNQGTNMGVQGLQQLKEEYEKCSISKDCIVNVVDWKHAGALQKMEVLAKSASHYKAYMLALQVEMGLQKTICAAVEQVFALESGPKSGHRQEKTMLRLESKKASDKLKSINDARKQMKDAKAKLGETCPSEKKDAAEKELEAAVQKMLKLFSAEAVEPHKTKKAKKATKHGRRS